MSDVYSYFGIDDPNKKTAADKYFGIDDANKKTAADNYFAAAKPPAPKKPNPHPLSERIATAKQSLGITAPTSEVKRIGSAAAYQQAQAAKDAAANKQLEQAAIARSRFNAQHNYGLSSPGAPNIMKPAERAQGKQLMAQQQKAIEKHEQRFGPDTLLEHLSTAFGAPGLEKQLDAQAKGSVWGTVQKFAGGIVDSIPDLAIAAASEGIMAPGSGAVNRVFQVQMVRGLAATASNKKMQKEDPQQFYTSIVLQSLALGATSARLRAFMADKLKTAVTGQNEEARAKNAVEKQRAEAENESFRKNKKLSEPAPKEKPKKTLTVKEQLAAKKSAPTTARPLQAVAKAEEQARTASSKPAEPVQTTKADTASSKPKVPPKSLPSRHDLKEIHETRKDKRNRDMLIDEAAKAAGMTPEAFVKLHHKTEGDYYLMVSSTPRGTVKQYQVPGGTDTDKVAYLRGPKPQEESDAVQKQGATESVSRESRSEVELPGVGKGDGKEEVAGKGEAEKEAKAVTRAPKGFKPSRDDKVMAPDANGVMKPGVVHSHRGKLSGIKFDDGDVRSVPTDQLRPPSTGIGKGGKASERGGITLNWKPGGKTAVALEHTYAAARNKLYEGASHLREFAKNGLDKSYASAVRASSSFAEARVQAREHVPKVLAHMDEEQQSKFQSHLVIDRAIQDRNTRLAQIHMKQLLLKSMIKAKAPISATDAIGKEIRDLRRDIKENIITRNENAHGVSIPGVTVDDPVTGLPISEKDVHGFFKEPDVIKALDYHKTNVEPILRENFEYDGRMAIGDRGMYSGAFTPATALDENGMPLRAGMSSTSGRFTRVAEVPGKPGAKEFKASAKYYDPSYHNAIEGRFNSGFRAKNIYNMFKDMHDEGLMQSILVKGKTKAGNQTSAVSKMVPNGNVRYDAKLKQWQVRVKGVWEKGTLPFKIQDKVNKYVAEGAKYASLPGTEVVMPQRVYNEIEPLFYKEGSEPFQDVSNRFASNVIKTTLMGVGESGAHGRALAGRLGKTIPFIQRGGALSKAIQTGPLTALNSLGNLIKVTAGTWRYPEDLRYKANLEAAHAGALPSHTVAYEPLEGTSGKAKAGTVLRNVARTGGVALYAPKGILSNVHTAIYKYYQDAGLLSDPRARMQMHEDMRFMNTHSEILTADIGKKRGGGSRLTGTFAQTGFKNRNAVYRGGLGMAASRMVGTTLLFGALAKARDPQHRYPWEIPGYVTGNIYLGQDKNGNSININLLQFMDRTQDYGQAWVNEWMRKLSEGESIEMLLRRLVSEGANQIAGPVLSGPFRFIEGTTGIHPSFWTPDEKGLPMPYQEQPTVGLPLTDAKYNLFRMRRGVESVLGMLYIADPLDYSITKPADERLQWLNRFLRLTGSPALKSEDEERIKNSASNKEKRMRAAQTHSEKIFRGQSSTPVQNE